MSKISIYTGFIFESDELFEYRLDLLKRTAAPSLAMQSHRDFTWQVLVKEKHTRKFLLSMMGYPGNISVIDVPDNEKWQNYPNRQGYGVWRYFNYNSYDIQIRLDSDDFVSPMFLKTVLYIAEHEKDLDTLISFQYKKLDLASGVYYRQARKWDKRCSALAVLLNAKNMNIFASNHSALQNHAKKYFYIPNDSFYTVCVHDEHGSVMLKEKKPTAIFEEDTMLPPAVEYRRMK
jgi:hypothetical protein